MQSRYYDPEICRFINADDAAMILQEKNNLSEFNIFSYCYNNCINAIDPYGLKSLVNTRNKYVALIMLMLVAATFLCPVLKRMIESILNAVLSAILYLVSLLERAISRALRKIKGNSLKKPEIHHIVAKSARWAGASRKLLELAGISVESSINKTPVRYELHKHLHSMGYHLGVTAYLLGMIALLKLSMTLSILISLILLGILLAAL